MRTFQAVSPLSEPKGDEEIDRFTLSYMGGLARDRIHQLVLSAFIESGLTKSQLAKRMGKDKSRVSKILNTSSNLTAETFGEVLFAIEGSCPAVSRTWPLRESRLNLREPAWFSDCVDAVRIHHISTPAEIKVSTTQRPTFRIVSAETRELENV